MKLVLRRLSELLFSPAGDKTPELPSVLRPLAGQFFAAVLRPTGGQSGPVLDPCLTVDVARDPSRSASLRAASLSQVLLILAVDHHVRQEPLAPPVFGHALRQ